MSLRDTTRLARRSHREWWVVTAWLSLVLVVVAGLAAAAGV